MPQSIRDVLNRRNDLSTFVVHLTREFDDVPPADNLRRIIQQRRLKARTPMGWAATQDDSSNLQAQTQRVVSFSETPLEHIYSLVADIASRRVNLRPYGLAVTKMAARRLGVNPVWYVDMTPGRTWEAAAAVDALRDAAIASGSFHQQPVARFAAVLRADGDLVHGSASSGGNASGVTSATLKLACWILPFGCAPKRKSRRCVSSFASS